MARGNPAETRSNPLRVVFGNVKRSLTIQAPPGPVVEAVRSMYANVQIPASGRDAPPDLTVSETAGGFELRSHADAAVQRFGTAAELVGALEFGVAHFLLGALGAHTHLHAAGAAAPGHEGRPAVLALGPSGSGKSSLALAWSRRGLPLLGDDVVLVDERGRLSAFPRPVRVDVARLHAVGARVAEPPLLDARSGKARFDPGEKGGWAEPGARAAVVARIAWSEGSSLRVEPLSGAEGLRLLIGSVLDTGTSPLDSFPRFADLLEGVRVVDVRFGDAAEAAEALAELLP